MSRVGRAPVFFDKPVTVTISPMNDVTVKGQKHTMVVKVRPELQVKVEEGNKIVVSTKNNMPTTRAYHGLFRALIQNAVTGVTKGWTRELELNGVGYRAAVSGKKLEQRTHIQPLGQPLQGVLVARQSLAVDEDVEAGILAFHHNVKACRHRYESMGELARIRAGIPDRFTIRQEGCFHPSNLLVAATSKVALSSGNTFPIRNVSIRITEVSSTVTSLLPIGDLHPPEINDSINVRL